MPTWIGTKKKGENIEEDKETYSRHVRHPGTFHGPGTAPDIVYG